jgi:hypothetical protein
VARTPYAAFAGKRPCPSSVTGPGPCWWAPYTCGFFSTLTHDISVIRSRDARSLWSVAKYAVLTCIRCRLRSNWSPSGEQAETRERFIELFSNRELSQSDWVYYLDIEPLDDDDAEELTELENSLSPQDKSLFISLAHYRSRRMPNFRYIILTLFSCCRIGLR